MSDSNAIIPAADGRHDFDFLFGRWSIANRRLRRPLSKSNDWFEFKAVSLEAPILGGSGNIEHYDAPEAPIPIHAIALRLYNQRTGKWSIYWSTAGAGEFLVPTVGAFQDGVGVFCAREEIGGRPTLVRFTWTHRSPPACRWVQAFSADGGETWEDNWIMDFTRVGT